MNETILCKGRVTKVEEIASTSEGTSIFSTVVLETSGDLKMENRYDSGAKSVQVKTALLFGRKYELILREVEDPADLIKRKDGREFRTKENE